jgi:hypothetical protein
MSYQPDYYGQANPCLIRPVSTVKQELDRKKNGAVRQQIVHSARDSAKESTKNPRRNPSRNSLSRNRGP